MIDRQRGVTLLELMTALAVLAILMGVGVPAFNNIVRNSQIAAQSAGLVQALNLARSEALKRGVRVSVCAAAASGNDCGAAAAWNNGWIVFADDFGAAGVIDPADLPFIIQNWPAQASGVQITIAQPSVTFTRMGRAEFARTFTVSKSGCSGDQRRQIGVATSGRIGLQHLPCS
ncbi:MAG: GspH/FimT family pseudopilin [Steroidobacter sp.]